MNKKTKSVKAQQSSQAKAPAPASKPKTDPSAVLQNTPAGVIWDEIRNLTIEMFALPGQIVEMHCRPVPIDTVNLYLVASSSAVLPSLEVSLGSKFGVELADKYLVVTRNNK